MTKDEIFKIKEHIEICARRGELRSVKTAEILWRAVGELEHITELEKENAELKEKWLQATDKGTSWAHLKSLERENEELKELIENIIRVTWGEGWNYSLDWKVKAEQFIKDNEVEK